MKRTVTVEMLGITFTCEVEAYGPTGDDWYEVSIKSEGNLVGVLQDWSTGPGWGHYDQLMDKIAGKLCEEETK